MENPRIYLDVNASLPLRKEIRPFIAETLESLTRSGNPASIHAEGRSAENLVETAREQVAKYVGVKTSQVIFTSGGTEANAMAIQFLGTRLKMKDQVAKLGINGGSHASIRENVLRLTGWYQQPFLSPDELTDSNCSVIFELAASNESGRIADTAKTILAARSMDALIHVDAVQVPGKLMNFEALNKADSYSLSGHKVGALQGAGALIVSEEVSKWNIDALIRGGGQERGRRSGTPSVLAIATMGQAFTLPYDAEHCRTLAVSLRDGLVAKLNDKIIELSDCKQGLAGTLLIEFVGVKGDVMSAALDGAGVSASFGSACSSGEQEPSKSLIGEGISSDAAKTAIRFSIGPSTKAEEIDDAIERIVSVQTQVSEAMA
ncbi:MAG: aminotransferase class V-fold PLP-dependent enzyme [Candidatus Lindowbacteria bacterium]|nr:aminotransferase class V-fold PLP-dependent enzyme [Candidatus Lindowbacteria bacterium]